MLATLVGLSMLLAVVGGTATLLGCLLGRRWRARQARRHPQQAAAKAHTRQARRLGLSGPCSPRLSALAIGISGPASTASPQPSSSLTARA
jgi:hypothetical protein